MSLYCRYCHRQFFRADSRTRHEKHSCQSSGSEKTRDVPHITFPTKKHHGIPSTIEMGEAFRFKTPSSILIVGPSVCGKTCFTESLLLDHLEELFVNPPLRFIIASVHGKMDLETWKTLVCNFTKGFQSHTISSHGFRRVDYSY